MYETIENPAVVDVLPALSILPTPVELASLVKAVPAFQFQETILSLLPFTSLPSPKVNPSLSIVNKEDVFVPSATFEFDFSQ